jgi:uncharacterized protein YcbK (DUF882 family)
VKRAASPPVFSRRDLVRGAGAALLLHSLPWGARATPIASARALSFDHLHTGERLEVVYAEGPAYLPDALAEVNRLLRDHYSDEIHPIDRALLDLLHELQRRTGSSAPLQVISGYRSPHTNARLRAQGRGVGRRSQHLLGKAVDIRLADVPSDVIRNVSLRMKRGGVGYYARNDFVHLDVGRVRRWNG